MNPKLTELKLKEFDDIFTSLEPELREDLARLDHRLRRITYEAATFGVSAKIVQEKLNERFWNMWNQVAKGEINHG